MKRLIVGIIVACALASPAPTFAGGSPLDEAIGTGTALAHDLEEELWRWYYGVQVCPSSQGTPGTCRG